MAYPFRLVGDMKLDDDVVAQANAPQPTASPSKEEIDRLALQAIVDKAKLESDANEAQLAGLQSKAQSDYMVNLGSAIIDDAFNRNMSFIAPNPFSAGRPGEGISPQRFAAQVDAAKMPVADYINQKRFGDEQFDKAMKQGFAPMELQSKLEERRGKEQYRKAMELYNMMNLGQKSKQFEAEHGFKKEESQRKASEFQSEQERKKYEFQANYDQKAQELADRRAERDAERIAKKDKLSKEQADNLKETHVPFTEDTGELTMAKPEIPKARATAAGMAELTEKVRRLEDVYKSVGGGRLIPKTDAYNRAMALTNDLMMTLKGPAFYDLGVPSGPDMKILVNAAGGSPDEFGKAFAEFLGGQDPLGQLKSTAESNIAAAQNRLRSWGKRDKPTEWINTKTGAKKTAGMIDSYLLDKSPDWRQVGDVPPKINTRKDVDESRLRPGEGVRSKKFVDDETGQVVYQDAYGNIVP